MKKRALIFGISGQDGYYLSKLLLDKGYQVFGTSRNVERANFINLEKLGFKNQIKFFSVEPQEFKSVSGILQKTQVDEIYNLAGQSSVGLSFEDPKETLESNLMSTLNILEAARCLEKPPRIYFAGSSEIFGELNGQLANEKTNFNPKSPYAVSKASAYWLVDNYRKIYDLFACTGIAFNHESFLRPKTFVTQKIVSSARRIASGSKELLELGRLDIARDWGWAPEFVEAMWLMLQKDKAEDFVLATGETNTLKAFVEASFNYFDLNWEDHVKQNKAFKRPLEILINGGDATKAQERLGWKAKFKMKDVVRLMIEEKV
jgi:GDPmannose 4,6-dehydratase